MSNEVASNQSQSTKKVQTLLARTSKKVAALLNLVNAFSNYAESTSAQGSAVLAGGNIAPLVTMTVKASGKFRVYASTTYTNPAGHVTPLVSAGVHSGLLTAKWSGSQNSLTEGDMAAVFDFVSGGAKGTQWDFAFTTTVGDQTATLGAGGAAAGVSASFIVQELPF
jgi:hypothetical protein